MIKRKINYQQIYGSLLTIREEEEEDITIMLKAEELKRRQAIHDRIAYMNKLKEREKERKEKEKATTTENKEKNKKKDERFKA